MAALVGFCCSKAFRPSKMSPIPELIEQLITAAHFATETSEES
jgi:hypothetical protein